MGIFDNVINKFKEPPKPTYVAPTSSKMKFVVAGVNYRMDQVIKLATPMKKWDMTNEELMRKYSNKKIYRYFFTNEPVVLVPEPTNQHDPNAIKVMINNIHVGYVPKEDCARVKGFIQAGNYTLSAYITGGEYKIIYDIKSAAQFSDPVSIEITISR